MRLYGHGYERTPEDTTRCIAELTGRVGVALHLSPRRQCERKRGHGRGGLYCTRHARMMATGGYVETPPDDTGQRPNVRGAGEGAA